MENRTPTLRPKDVCETSLGRNVSGEGEGEGGGEG